MSINVTSSSTTSVNSTNSSTQVSSASSSDVSKKSSADSSFKEEMEKVSSKENQENSESKVEAEIKSEDVSKDVNNNDSAKDITQDSDEDALNAKFATLAMLDMNSQLSNGIQEMVKSNSNISGLHFGEVMQSSQGLSLNFSPSNISMSKADADFFVNLTKNNDVSVQNIMNQAQNLLNNGADVSQVKQSSQISQTLLNALMTAKENNQPLRIDFDQNISVILRVGKDGVLAANFIPGDKAVEQYLRNNIESLKNTFRENELPYSDLSYSNRGSKQQKENRRNKQ